MPDPAHEPVKVFLSYASEDAAAARQIAEALTAAGIEAWFDQSELRGGDAWDQKIRRQIRECHLFVPLVSAQTQARAEGYFRLEWHLAEQRSFLLANDQPFIVPVVIDGTAEAVARVPDRFRERQWTRVASPAGAAELAQRLIVLSGRGRPPGPGPAIGTGIPPARSERSVAVLPFANLSADPENEYFSDGISDELLTLLQGIPGLRVAARTSAFSFKGKSATAEEIGSRLGVAHLVEGSVQKSGTRVKIMARLSSTAGEVRWSRSFTRELNDVFALQEELAGAIVGELKGQLSAGEANVASQVHDAAKGGTRNPEAHQRYLVGKHLFNSGSAAAVHKAVEEFKRAVAVDPDFALAWSSLGWSYSWLCGYDTMTAAQFDETLARAREASAKALALEPDLVLSLALMAWISYAFDFKLEEARRWMARVLAIGSSDPDVLVIAATIVGETQGSGEALEILQRAASIDPVNARIRTQLCLLLVERREFDRARAEAERAIALSSTSVFAQTLVPFIEVVQGNSAEALRQLDGVSPTWSAEWVRIVAEHRIGRGEDARRRLERFCSAFGESAAIQAAVSFACLGEADLAFEWLERARRQRDPGLLSMRDFVFWDSVRGDPRWAAFWSRLGVGEKLP